MKKTLSGLTLGLLALGLAGCATTPSDRAAGGTALVNDPYDRAYISLVDHVAKERGVRVIWVNAPRRSADKVRVSYPALNISDSEDPGAGSR